MEWITAALARVNWISGGLGLLAAVVVAYGVEYDTSEASAFLDAKGRAYWHVRVNPTYMWLGLVLGVLSSFF